MGKLIKNRNNLNEETQSNDNIFIEESSNLEVINVSKKKKRTRPVKVYKDDTTRFLERFKIKKTSEEKDDTYSNINRYLDTDISVGLTDEEVSTRISQNKTNKNVEEKGKTILEIIISNVFTWFNMLYFIVALILIFIDIKNKDSFSNLTFLLLVIVNTCIGLFQELKTKIQVDKLKLLSNPKAVVIRNGKEIEINTDDLVLDDIIVFQTGKQICADSIVLDGSIEVNEALLTGEADSLVKNSGDSLLSGSFVTSGTCIARVDKVGKDCYISKMSNDAKKYNPPKSELLSTLHKVIVTITILIIPVIVLYILSHINIASLQHTPNFFHAFWNRINMGGTNSILSAICYIVLAMIPAGLFLLTSIALFVGVRRLSKQNTLVQELYCIEMLARVDTLCLDKTGTITDGSMQVIDCIEINNNSDYTIREIVGSILKSYTEINQTSEALINYFGVNEVLTPTVYIPFSSKRKYSAVTFNECGTYVIGAPDFVISNDFDSIKTKVEKFAQMGNRVLVLGHTTSIIKEDKLPNNVKPVALIILQDHIRDDAAETISFFKLNGVDVKVISGDDPETVSKIASRVGIENANRYINLNGLSDEEIKNKIFDYTVFGRVTPNQKKLIVETLKANGRTVAMTGDGVNDIPALKEADCSIAMASGSESCRYVSHLVLMDSNFSSMPNVVMEGRRVINNVQKTSSLFLTKNLFAFLLAIMYIVIGFVTLYSKQNYVLYNTDFPFRSENLMLIEMVILGFATTLLAIQPNRDIVKGKFITNVIKQILPGAFTVLVFQVILFLTQMFKLDNEFIFSKLFNPEYPDIYRTISSLITTLIMIFVLMEACRPFNNYRRFIFISVVSVIIVAIALPPVRSFLKLDFTNFGSTEYMLLIILIQAVYPVMLLIKKIFVKKEIDLTKFDQIN